MLESEYIYLRKMEVSDTDNIVKWRNTESVRSRFIYQGLFTVESHLNWIETMVNTGKVVQMIICEKDTNRPIGSAYIRDIDRKHNKGEYGLFIGESMSRGKGIGAEVTRLMLKYAFEELKLHRIYSRVLSDNIISLKSAFRGGLEQEGFCKDDVFLNGTYQDVYLLGKINPNDNNGDFTMHKNIIDGKKIYFRKMEEEDTSDIIRWRNNPRVQNRFIYQELFTPNGHKKWIENMVNEGKVVQFIIYEKETNRKIGSTYLRDIDRSHNKAEYGIFIGEDDAVGKGYGSEAAKMMIRYGFHILKLHKIFLRVFEENVAAIKSYEKAGFVIEAKLREDVYKDDTYVNMLLMAIINPEEEKDKHAIS